MVRKIIATTIVVLGMFVLTPTAMAQPCEGTPFACAVDDAINAGLQHFRNQEVGQGHFGDGTGRHNFLGALSFLEKRRGADHVLVMTNDKGATFIRGTVPALQPMTRRSSRCWCRWGRAAGAAWSTSTSSRAARRTCRGRAGARASCARR